MKRSLLYRLNQYQKERFPLSVLIFTTLSVVLSSATMVGNGTFPDSYWKIVPVALLTCLLFMFSLRVFDEEKDHTFDSIHYENRPVQRGLVTIRELRLVNSFFWYIQIIATAFVSLLSVAYWLLAFAYSLFARKEFFLGEKIRKHFLLYNLLNLLQMFFLQLYLYSLFVSNIHIQDMYLWIHFVFVLLNAMVLEVARKLKDTKSESTGKDTYSSRYGRKLSSLMYGLTCALSLLTFTVLMNQFGWNMFFYAITTVVSALILITTIWYARNSSKLAARSLQASAIIFYLLLHLQLFGVGLV